MNRTHYSTLLFLLLFSSLILAQNKKAVLLKTGATHYEPNIQALIQKNNLGIDATLGNNGYALVQFDELPNDDQLRAITSLGIELLEYIPYNTYVASIPTSLSPNTISELGIIGVFDIPLSNKMDEALLTRAIPGWALAGNKVESILKYHKNIPQEQALKWCRENGITTLKHNKYNNFIRVQFPIQKIEEIAGLPWVAYLDLVPGPDVPDDTGGRSLHRSNIIDVDYSGGRHYNGEGVNVLVRDDGFVGPHIDFHGRIDNSFVEPQTGNHGDGVAGVMAGAGNIDPTMKGMAAGAFVYVVNYEDDFLDETMDLFYDKNVIVTNSSYSNGCNAGYTAITETVDQQLYNNPTLMHVFSAGNSNNNDCDYGAGNQWGNITGGHKMAKNCLTTANVYADATLVESSSRGPAFDGRLKPDISAHGQGQWSTDEQNTYQEFGGTSAAAPCIAGVMAQLHQAYRELNAGEVAEAALLKAILLNTVTDMGNRGPDFKFGWGLVNAYRAVLTLEDHRYLKSSVAPGNNSQHVLSIPQNVQEARFMVYWMDPEATPMTSKALINDLDIKVIGPDGTEYLPWKLDPTPDPAILDTPAGKGVDSLNNMEQVVLDNPSAGDYTLVINGKELPFGSHEYYVTWEFRTAEIKMTYPAGGESFEPGETTRLHWNAQGDNGFFIVWLSTDDGVTFNPINSVEGDLRLVKWTVPDTVITSKAKIKITRAGQEDITEVPFSIAPRTQNLKVTQACPDYIRYEWDAVDLGSASATVAYEILTLGDRYMEVIDTVTGTTYDLPAIDQNPLKDHWLSVRALGDNGLRSERTIAVLHNTGLLNCTQQIDLALSNVDSPDGTILFGCGQIDTEVSIEVANEGLQAQSGISVAFQLDGQAPVVESLPGTLDPGSSVNYTFNTPLSISSGGVHQLSLAVVDPNDQANFNNLVQMEIEAIIYQGPGESVEYNEGFEGTQFPPPYYFITNPDESIGWERTVITGVTGDTTQTMFMNNRFYSTTGQNDIFQVIPIDLSSGTKPQLSFDVAYTYRSNLSDELKVELSTDCGASFETVYDKAGAQLATVPPQNGFFAPSEPGHWRKEKIDLTSYIGNTLVLKFTNITGRGNSLYLDNINVKEITPPTASFNASIDTICQGETITYYNTSTGPDTDVSWVFGSGANPSTSNNKDSVVVTYNEIGEHTVLLTVENIAGSSSESSKVFVQPLPDISFNFTNDDETVSFENTTLYGDNYVWNFGDGVFALTQNPTHEYPALGTYTVTLTVTNDCGTTTYSQDITIMATATIDLTQRLSATVNPNPNSGKFNLSIKSDQIETLIATLLNVRGQVLLKKEFTTKQGATLVKFDNYLPPGLYVLRLSAKDATASLKVMVK